MKKFGKSSRERSQGVPKIFTAPIHRTHCAVIFAIAQLSCYTIPTFQWLQLHYYRLYNNDFSDFGVLTYYTRAEKIDITSCRLITFSSNWPFRVKCCEIRTVSNGFLFKNYTMLKFLCFVSINVLLSKIFVNICGQGAQTPIRAPLGLQCARTPAWFNRFLFRCNACKSAHQNPWLSSTSSPFPTSQCLPLSPGHCKSPFVTT